MGLSAFDATLISKDATRAGCVGPLSESAPRGDSAAVLRENALNPADQEKVAIELALNNTF